VCSSEYSLSSLWDLFSPILNTTLFNTQPKFYPLLGNDVPFSDHCTASLPALNNRHRLKVIRKFVGNSLEGKRVLDVGARNFISESLDIWENTTGDLNRMFRSPNEIYDVITCFEVLQHTFNMGLLLDNIWGHLRGGGTLYLSTPRQGLFAWRHGKENFTELKVDALTRLLEYKGFVVTRSVVKRSYPFRFCFYGVRPPFKWLCHKFLLVEAVKV